MNRGRLILFLFLSGLLSSGPNPLLGAEQQPLTAKSKIAAVVGCAATIFGIGYWAGSKAKKPTRGEIEELALKKGISKLNPSLRQKIHDYNGWNIKVRRERQILAPAVLNPPRNWANVAYAINHFIDVCEQENFKARRMIGELIKSRSIKNAFATFALHLPATEGITKEYNAIAQEGLSKSDVIAQPRAIIGRPLNPGECLIVAFSDNDVQILLSDSDRQTLNELSTEQINLIKFLHGYKEPELRLNGSQQRIFYYLPDQIKDKLSKNYGIDRDLTPPLFPTIASKISDQTKTNLQNIAAGAALGFGLYRWFKSQSTMEAAIRVLTTCGLLLPNVFSFIDSYYDGQWPNVWKVTLLAQLAIEAISLGSRMNNPLHYMAGKLAGVIGKKS